MAAHPTPIPWSNLLTGLHQAWPDSRWRDVGVVVGCSGGADSVALVRALFDIRRVPSQKGTARGFIVAAHFNHGIRGEESDGDQAFVSRLAHDWGIQFETARASASSTDEASMRSEREAFLRATAERLGARYVAVAHSADDNVETVLHHLLRGTGPAGLAGIPSHRDLGQDVVLVRPLLSMCRAAIRDGLRSIKQKWREDSSNEKTEYRRNWIRHQLIPLIETEYPDAVDAINRAIAGQQSWRQTIDALAQQWLDTHQDATNSLRLTRDCTTDESIIIAALQSIWKKQDWPRGDMSRTHWCRLASTIAANNDERYTLPGGIDVIADEHVVNLGKTSTPRREAEPRSHVARRSPP